MNESEYMHVEAAVAITVVYMLAKLEKFSISAFLSF